MPRVEPTDSGQRPGDGNRREYYAFFEFYTGEELVAELQASQRHEPEPVTRIELGWKTSLGQQEWLDGVDGAAPGAEWDALLGGNPDMMIRSTSCPAESPLETTYVDHRHRGVSLDRPDEVTVENGRPVPERLQAAGPDNLQSTGNPAASGRYRAGDASPGTDSLDSTGAGCGHDRTRHCRNRRIRPAHRSQGIRVTATATGAARKAKIYIPL
ncbi:MAG: hypothetical protein SVW77_01110 [Candidatus Nanohaloarchaea archaeon]|nr:hypothetical protein [Candidatus Nanohaloarchaea archaeon]